MNPWMPQGLLSSRKRKEKLLERKKKRSPCQINKDNFKQFDTLYTKLLRLAKQKTMRTNSKNTNQTQNYGKQLILYWAELKIKTISQINL